MLTLLATFSPPTSKKKLEFLLFLFMVGITPTPEYLDQKPEYENCTTKGTDKTVKVNIIDSSRQQQLS